jgi:hypothetical protein
MKVLDLKIPQLPPGKVWVRCLRCGEKAALYRNQANKAMLVHLSGKCLEVKGMY